MYSIYVELFDAKVQPASGQLYVLVEIDGYLKLKTQQILTIVKIFSSFKQKCAFQTGHRAAEVLLLLYGWTLHPD